MFAGDFWTSDWLWSLPLILATVLFHVIGFGAFNTRLPKLLGLAATFRRDIARFTLVAGAATLVVTVLHGLEALVWAFAYRGLDALPTMRRAMLYSLNAMTTYGHADDVLPERWRLMGALEALNGVILVGLTTAFLYGVIADLWSEERRRRSRSAELPVVGRPSD
ncbi:hypothetical protein [Methylocella sp.]|uniref:hypothetical protein n=1 Tax=Methylocella sp. TaxID=1978226 RepID=UPI003783A922